MSDQTPKTVRWQGDEDIVIGTLPFPAGVVVEVTDDVYDAVASLQSVKALKASVEHLDGDLRPEQIAEVEQYKSFDLDPGPADPPPAPDPSRDFTPPEE